MNALKFIGKSALMYVVGELTIGLPIYVLSKKLIKESKGKIDSCASAVGFEVDNEEWRNDDGEILVRGFTR